MQEYKMHVQNLTVTLTANAQHCYDFTSNDHLRKILFAKEENSSKPLLG